jgi:F-type H+-transporting ATPase subunit gamma
MSKRRDLEAHVRMLGDLRDVLESMKNLALVEIGKLSRTEEARRHMLDELMAVAGATSSYYPRLAQTSARVYVLIGSERSFCGDFSETIAQHWELVRSREPDAIPIAVGSALAEKVAPHTICVSGPVIAEDIDPTLTEILKRISDENAHRAGALGVAVIANGSEGIETTAILPFAPPPGGTGSVPPELNLAPRHFVHDFIDQYTDAALHSVFATSLLNENRARRSRMAVALDRLDESISTLRRRVHRLRQEEITQEVETILLNVQA